MMYIIKKKNDAIFKQPSSISQYDKKYVILSIYFATSYFILLNKIRDNQKIDISVSHGLHFYFPHRVDPSRIL